MCLSKLTTNTYNIDWTTPLLTVQGGCHRHIQNNRLLCFPAHIEFYEVYSKFRLGEFASITMKAQHTALFPRLIGRNDTQSDFREIWEGELRSGEEILKSFHRRLC